MTCLTRIFFWNLPTTRTFVVDTQRLVVFCKKVISSLPKRAALEHTSRRYPETRYFPYPEVRKSAANRTTRMHAFPSTPLGHGGTSLHQFSR